MSRGGVAGLQMRRRNDQSRGSLILCFEKRIRELFTQLVAVGFHHDRAQTVELLEAFYNALRRTGGHRIDRLAMGRAFFWRRFSESTAYFSPPSACSSRKESPASTDWC